MKSPLGGRAMIKGLFFKYGGYGEPPRTLKTGFLNDRMTKEK